MLQTLWLSLCGKSINRTVRVKTIFMNLFSHFLLLDNTYLDKYFV